MGLLQQGSSEMRWVRWAGPQVGLEGKAGAGLLRGSADDLALCLLCDVVAPALQETMGCHGS